MIPEDTNSNQTGPNVEERCKIDTGADANVMLISVFRRLYPAKIDSTGKALSKFGCDWTILKAYGGATIKWYEVRVIKGIWNNKKWKFIFHIAEKQGLVLLGLRTPRKLGIFIKHLNGLHRDC